MSQRVGFIGLGAMGLPMAGHLRDAGYEVTGYDVNADAMAAFENAGGRVAATPNEAAKDADWLVVVVFTAAQANEVLFGNAGALDALADGACVTMHTTMAPHQAEAGEDA